MSRVTDSGKVVIGRPCNGGKASGLLRILPTLGAMHRSLLLPPRKAMEASAVVDADLDENGNAAFAVGDRGVATHVVFADGAFIKLPKPLHNCALRLRDRDRVLVRGWGCKKPPFEEPDTFEVASDGTVRQSFLDVRYCSNFVCTPDRVVLTYYDDVMNVGIEHAHKAVAIFDWEGTFLWGWNDSRDLPNLYDCDGATRLGGNLVGVFEYEHFPLVVLDTGTCQPVEIHHPTPEEVHGAHAVARRDGVWCFLCPYDAPESALAWRPGRGRPIAIGAIPRPHYFRGLPDGKFIHVVGGRAEILQVTSTDVDLATR